MAQRVVITGLGTINPTGLNVKASWEAITNGRSGIGPITNFDNTGWLVRAAGQVKNFDPTQYMEAREARRRDPYQQFATVAAKEALAQSGLEITPANAMRVAVLMSSAVGGIKAFQDGVRAVFETGPRKVNPFTIPMLMPNGAGGMIGIDIGAQGPNFSIASACASANDGMGIAWHLVRSGMIDAAITGGSDATVLEIGIAAFDRLGAMSHRTEGLPQPFDLERDGVVMGEGAGAIVIESLEHAQARGAVILAELAGYAATSDAYHITAPAESGAGGAAAMRQALEAGGLNVEDLDYISAHGTGTQLNDASETAAVKRAFGQQAYQIPISSTKSMTGHMMGATGAVEAVFCVQAINTGVIPPTINYRTPDPVCDLDYVPNTAREAKVDAAISNAFGFGGHNAVLAFKRFVDEMPLPTFKDPSLMLRALTHRSYINEHAGAGEDNERLEFLGDAVLDFLSGSYLYRRFPELDEGGLTRMRAALVNTESLAALAIEIDLGQHLRLGKGEDDSGGRKRSTLLCDGFEAVMGAYYLDSGLEAVRAYVEPLFDTSSKVVILGEKEVDAKSAFQEWAQAQRGQTPRYAQLAVTGPDHNREYTVEVLVGDELFGTGAGPNKQAATQAAARAALLRTLGPA